MTRYLMVLLIALVAVVGSGCDSAVSSMEEAQDGLVEARLGISPIALLPDNETKEDDGGGGEECERFDCQADDDGGDEGEEECESFSCDDDGGEEGEECSSLSCDDDGGEDGEEEPKEDEQATGDDQGSAEAGDDNGAGFVGDEGADDKPGEGGGDDDGGDCDSFACQDDDGGDGDDCGSFGCQDDDQGGEDCGSFACQDDGGDTGDEEEKEDESGLASARRVRATSMTVAAMQERVKLEGRLAASSADPLASGKAKFETRADRARFSTEIEDVSTDGTGMVVVLRGGAQVFQAALSLAGGVADLNLDSRLGDAVPALAAGDQVRVFRADGTLILSGPLAQR